MALANASEGEGSGSPTGAAGGDLGGTYPNPKVAAITETSGPTSLVAGTIADGQFLKRVGSTLVSALAPVTSVFGRTGAVTAAASDYSLAQIAAGTNHALAVSGSSVMGSLAAGTSGQILTSQGSSADPAWETPGWSATFSLSNTAALSTLISQSIPGGTLGTANALLCTVGFALFNNSGASRGLTLKISYGGTAMWGDATSATFFAVNATLSYPLWWQFIIHANGTNSQRVAGNVLVGQTNSGSVAGIGTIAGGLAANATLLGTAAVDSTAAQTLLVQAQLSAASASLTLAGSVHVQAII